METQVLPESIGKLKRMKHLYADNEQHKEEFLSTLENSLPPFVARKEISTFLGGLVSSKTMRNADSRGEGPEVAYAVGQSIVYRREALIDWLRNKFPVQRLEHAKSLEV